MSMSDPIADMLTRIRNALLRERKTVSIPSSSIKENILKVFIAEGFIKGYKKDKARIGYSLIVELKYSRNGEAVIRKLQRLSKPGHRVHQKYRELKPVLNGQGISVVSTSKGVMSDHQCRKQKVGGEVLCLLY